MLLSFIVHLHFYYLPCPTRVLCSFFLSQPTCLEIHKPSLSSLPEISALWWPLDSSTHSQCFGHWNFSPDFIQITIHDTTTSIGRVLISPHRIKRAFIQSKDPILNSDQANRNTTESIANTTPDLMSLATMWSRRWDSTTVIYTACYDRRIFFGLVWWPPGEPETPAQTNWEDFTWFFL